MENLLGKMNLKKKKFYSYIPLLLILTQGGKSIRKNEFEKEEEEKDFFIICAFITDSDIR